MSNFTDVSELNHLIGNAQGNPSNPDWDALASQLELIKEEFQELIHAIEQHDFTEVRDAVADILVTTYGLAYRAGVNADADMDEVHASNMSKFCSTREEAIHTAHKYEKLGVMCSYRQPVPGITAVVSASDQTGKDGKFYPEGKLLKSINFKEPKLL